MKVVVSPYYEATGPSQMLYRGRFIKHYDLLQRGQEIYSGLDEAGCIIEMATLPGDEDSDCLDLILSIHDDRYIYYLKNAWVNWSSLEDSSAEIFTNISPNRHIAQFNEHPVALAGWYVGDAAAPIGEHTWRNALGSVCAVIEAALKLTSEESAMYALCRPSGHHACQDMAMGMCFLNNVAIAAQVLRQKFSRVAILDIDMHHGNGTQQIFYQRDDVLTLSIHGDPSHFYPFYSGFEQEIGVEEGEGFNLNLPLPAGTGEVAYLNALNEAGNKILKFGAEALIVATGFDTFIDDPLGCFQLESSSYYGIGRMIRSLQLPTLFVQEGGYFVPALRENTRQLILGFESI